MIAQSERSEHRASRGLGGRAGNQFGLLLSAVAAVLATAGGYRAMTADVNGYGIISALPLLYWIGFAVAVAATALLLWGAADKDARLAAPLPFVWLLLLHTAPQLAHAHVRLPQVWGNLGLVRTMEANQAGDMLVDGRMAWPGFFGTFIASLARLDSDLLEVMLRIWPTYITGGTAVLVAALAKRAYPTMPMIGTVSALVYVLLAWTGHDYFSSGSIGFLWFVAIVVVLENGPLRTGSAWSAALALLPRFATSGGERPATRSTAAVVTLVLFGLGAIVVHPVAPLYIMLALAVLGLYGRSVAWRLLVLLAITYSLWHLIIAGPGLPSGATGLSELFGLDIDPFGATTAEASLSPSAQHQLVERVRVYMAWATVGLALAVAATMCSERFRHLRPTTPLAPLAVVGLAGVLIGGFDGRNVAQALVYALPAMSVLIGRSLVTLRIRSLPVVVTILTVLVSPLLLVARFGNESFEYATGPDRAAVETAYAQARGDTLFVADNKFVPWGDRWADGATYLTLPVATTDGWISDVRAHAAQASKDRIVVVLTESQQAFRTHVRGESETSLNTFVTWLIAEQNATVLHNDGAAWAIELRS